VVHDHPLAFEHDADPPVAKPAALARDVLHGVTDGTMVGRAFTPNRFGIDTNQHAGPALRDLVIPQHPQHRFTPLARCRQTFPNRSLRMTE
jgi:hypothetical protein